MTRAQRQAQRRADKRARRGLSDRKPLYVGVTPEAWDRIFRSREKYVRPRA